MRCIHLMKPYDAHLFHVRIFKDESSDYTLDVNYSESPKLIL